MAARADDGIGVNSPVEPFFFASRDGLRLHGLDYRGDNPALLPAVCLPGQTRTVRDFHALALRLQADGRRVVAFDLRGRGQSDRDPTAKTYLPVVEAQDVLDGLSARGIARAAYIGTSRGGIVTMVIGGMAPAAIGAAVLNDIGSVIDTAGLRRIGARLGKVRPPAGWSDAADQLAAALGDEFPAFGPDDWLRQAHLTFADQDGLPVSDFDPNVAAGFHGIKADAPPVDLTPAFASLANVPMLVIRGGCSHLLSRETVAAMGATHPKLESFEVEGQGHAPELDGTVAGRIADFLARVAG